MIRANISITRSVTTTVIVLASTEVSWVMVNTKTRSKNSSSVLTRTGWLARACDAEACSRTEAGSVTEAGSLGAAGSVTEAGSLGAAGSVTKAGSVTEAGSVG